MGYYTNYTLKVLDESKNEVTSLQHPEWEETILDGGYLAPQNLIDDACDSMKWYDHEKEMLELSKQHKEYVFILDGDGEESGDVWRKFYKNGKTYEWKVQVNRPEFNEKNLS